MYLHFLSIYLSTYWWLKKDIWYLRPSSDHLLARRSLPSKLIYIVSRIRKLFAHCPGLVVMGVDSRSKGRGFESRRWILDGHDVFHIHLLWKLYCLFEKRPGLAQFLRKLFARLPNALEQPNDMVKWYQMDLRMTGPLGNQSCDNLVRIFHF